MSWFDKKLSPKSASRLPSTYRADFLDLVDEVFSEWNQNSIQSQNFIPQMNVSENENSYEIETELPGVDKQDVKVEFKDHVLTIQGQKQSCTEKKDDHFHLIERNHGSFSRTLRLPNDSNPEKIQASMEHGVLHISIEKTEEGAKKKRTIHIK